MVIQLKRLFGNEGESFRITSDLDFSHLIHDNRKPFHTPVHIEGSAENRVGIVTVGYLATFTLSTLCDRCLAPIERPYSMRFEHTVVNKLYTDENDELILCEENGSLDLGLLVASDILLELPIKMLCREDCKGLCPKCGTNLNESSCGCDTRQIDPRLEALRKLLEQDDYNS